MNVVQSIILGFVQGLTEFIPVSSSGHLIVIPKLFFWNLHSLAFDTTLHLATALALIVYFFDDMWKIGVSFIKDVWEKEDSFDKYSKDGKMGLFILVGSIPAGLIGFFLKDQISEYLRTPFMVGVFLILGSFFMFLAEYFSKDRKIIEKIKKIRKIKKIKRDKIVGKLDLGKAFVIGLCQSLALMPGFSRSGATISGGVLFGLKRKDAAKFSFLLSIPIVMFAGLYQLYNFVRYSNEQVEYIYLIVGFLVSFLTGLFAIRFLMRYLNSKKLYPFIIYRLILALVIFTLVLAEKK